MYKKNNAFSLIEILSVICIVGILSVILIPTISNVQNLLIRSKNKIFLSELIAALENYKSTYGNYPDCLNSSNTEIDSYNVSENLIKSLTSKNPNGDPLSSSDQDSFNKNNLCFLSDIADNLLQESNRFLFVDHCKNPHIFFFIKSQSKSTILPTDIRTEIKELIPPNGLRKEIICFTIENKEEGFQTVVSWNEKQ